MRSFITALVSVTLASFAAAQNMSAPFTLSLSSPGKYNGTYLAACHEGAAIESLCPQPANSTLRETFNFNTSAGNQPSSTIGTPGVLTFTLRGSNFNYSQAMGLSYNPSSNVALPLFVPDNEPTYVAFDSANHMNIQSAVDDRVSPPKIGTQAYYRWYVCQTEYGYLENTLSWVAGEAKPENPSCEKVEVIRTFV